MGSRGWLRKIISLKKEKNGNAKSPKKYSQKESPNTANNVADENPGTLALSFEDIAAIRIQSAFRAHKARKILRLLKGTLNLRTLALNSSVSKQASSTLRHLHTWSRIQSEIRVRRISMADARVRQKNLENQLKLDAKLHDLEVEWDCGTKTMEQSVANIYLREAAAVKRERTMAYAFSHQWRANSNPVLNNDELGKASWGWTWTGRWISAQPWESRALVQPSPKKAVSRQSSKNGKNLKSPTIKPMHTVKSISANGKITIKARKLSYEKPDQEATANKEQTA